MLSLTADASEATPSSVVPNGHAYDDFGSDGRTHDSAPESKTGHSSAHVHLHFLPKEVGFFSEFIALLATSAQGKCGFAERQCQVREVVAAQS